jgi:hypothetical protein
MAETKTDNTNLPAMQSGGKVGALVPNSFSEIVQIAGAVVRAGMAPKSLDTTEKATVAIMHGMELGLTPMAALQSIAVINGTPATYGDGMLALCRASGHLEDIREEVEWGNDGPLSATCEVRRRGEKTPGKHIFTRDDAVKAGLWKKAGPWTQYPQRMLAMRARAWALRDKFADVLRGLRSAEEMEDMVDVTPQGSATTPHEPKKADYEKPKDPPPTEPEKKPEVPKPAAKRGAKAKAKDQPAPQTAPPEGDKPADDKKPGITDVVDENDKPPADDIPVTFENYARTGDFFAFADPWIVDEKRTEAELVAFRSFYNDYMNERLDPTFKSKGVHEAMLDTERVFKEALKLVTGK